jgi:alpha-tubulin suppressor-like RCC1 family protein
VGALTDWYKVSGGTYSSYAIKTDGTLWSWGGNGLGQLGLGTSGTNYSSPKQVGALTDWAVIQGSNNWCLAIKTNGTLWSWGGNSVGQLGTNNLTNYSSPVQVGALTTWSKIANGRYFAGAVKTDGTLWTWGQNQLGQLGLGNTVYAYSSPKQVGALTNWSNIACGDFFCLATKSNNQLWSWGSNVYGQLGLNNTTNYSSPKQVGTLTSWLNITGGGYHSAATTVTTT